MTGLSTSIVQVGRTIPGRSFRQLLRVESRLAWRQPVGLVWGVAMPIVFLIIFGNIPAFSKPISAGSPLSVFEVYIPVMVAMALSMIALESLPVPLVVHREQGWLRRLSTTPVRPIWLLAAKAVVNLVLALTAMVVIVIGSSVFLGARLPGHLGGFVIAALLVTLAVFAMGMLIAAIAPTSGWAGVIGLGLFFPLMFLAGLWVPLQYMPSILRTIGDYTPVAVGVVAMQSSMQGDFPEIRDLLVLGAFALVFGATAVRFFHWE